MLFNTKDELERKAGGPESFFFESFVKWIFHALFAETETISNYS